MISKIDCSLVLFEFNKANKANGKHHDKNIEKSEAGKKSKEVLRIVPFFQPVEIVKIAFVI